MSAANAFALVRETVIEEYAITARLYRHRATGAEVLSMVCPDENKVFGVSFRTPPADSTGVPHILEHSVLCGSRRYPVKEPFVELLKGSLQTFLNAFTYPDKTCYPVASANLADFYNLVGVYLDAVFYPRIPEEIFGQEGWHFENQDGQLVYKGVVYNEMKGVYSSPDSLLGEMTQRALFPATTYGVNSGGEPSDIPNLTYRQFKDFHTRYYHPSNARFFFYGDDDPERRLDILQDYLKDFTALEVDSEVGLQPRFCQPKRVEFPYACGAAREGHEAKALFTLNWLLPEVFDVDRLMALSVLEHVLIGLSASPLRKALIDSGLGEDVAGIGLESELRQMYFSTGLKGLAASDIPAAEELILSTLSGLAATGVAPEAVEAAVNTLEFRLRENNTGSFPRGLSLMLRALTTWLHGDDPLTPLRFDAPLAAFKSRLTAGEPVLENLIREHFLENPHRVTVVLLPDPELSARLAAEEQARLEAAQARLSSRERAYALELAERITKFQETPDSPEDLATIPKLHLADLPVTNTLTPGVWREGRVFHHDLPTNGVIYCDLGFDLSGVDADHLPLLPLFARALVEMGTDTEDFATFAQRIARKTGGISRDIHFSAMVGRPAGDEAVSRLVLRAKATPDKTEDMLDILEAALTRANFDDEDRFRQMLFESKARAERNLAPSGHAYAARRLRARFHRAALAEERVSGLTAIESLRTWAGDFSAHWPQLRDALHTLRAGILRQGNLCANVTLDAKQFAAFEPALAAMRARLPQGASAPALWPALQWPEREGLSAPVQVNYVAQGQDINGLGVVKKGAMMVACRYLRNAYLWERVRVRGGAYGAFCSFDRWSGLLTMLSYRDPGVLPTLEAFAQAGPFLAGLDISPDELERTVIGAVGDIDAYQLPDAKGYGALLRHWAGDTEAIRQSIRDEVMGTTLADLRRCGEVMEAAMRDAPVVALGSPESLEKAAPGLPGLVLTRAL